MYKELISGASKNIDSLLELKQIAKKVGANQLVDELSKLEIELFPISQEEKEAKNRVEELDLAFRMVGVQFKEPIIYYLIDETMKVFNKKKGKFDLKDASKIECNAKSLFKR